MAIATAGYFLAGAALLRGYAGYRGGLAQARALRRNAKELMRAAEQTESGGRTEARRIEEASRFHQDAIASAASAEGFRMMGTPLRALATVARRDALAASQRITQSRLEAARMRRAAKAMREQAGDAALGGTLAGVAGLLGGGGELMSAYESGSSPPASGSGDDSGSGSGTSFRFE